MACDRISRLDRVRITRGPGREVIAAREVREPRSDRGLRRASHRAVVAARVRATSGRGSVSASAVKRPARCAGPGVRCGGAAPGLAEGWVEPSHGAAADLAGACVAWGAPRGVADPVPDVGAVPMPAGAQSSPGVVSPVEEAASISTGESSPLRTDRSRRVQQYSIWDHMPGYVLAHEHGGFRFAVLRTVPGMLPRDGHEALKDLRIGLRKRFAYVDGLAMQPSLFDESLVHVAGSGWHAHWSLERSADGSPHYQIMFAILGYDVAAFEAAVRELWAAAVARVLGVSRALGRRDLYFGRHLGGETVDYMVQHKRTGSGQHDAHDFSDVVGEGEGLGTRWHGSMGGRCLKLVKGHGEYVPDDVPVEELRERAATLDRVRWGGRPVPDRYAHARDAKTGRLLYVVPGPWSGHAALYMVTGSFRHLLAYRRARLECRQRKRAAEPGDDFLTSLAMWI